MPRYRRDYSDPIRYLGDFHDFIRVLWYLHRGLTKYRFAQLMSLDDNAAYARLEGWVRAGVVEKRDDGKYYLVSGRFKIPEFGEIEVNDHTVVIKIDPTSKFRNRAKYGIDAVRVQVIRDTTKD